MAEVKSTRRVATSTMYKQMILRQPKNEPFAIGPDDYPVMQDLPPVPSGKDERELIKFGFAFPGVNQEQMTRDALSFSYRHALAAALANTRTRIQPPNDRGFGKILGTKRLRSILPRDHWLNKGTCSRCATAEPKAKRRCRQNHLTDSDVRHVSYLRLKRLGPKPVPTLDSLKMLIDGDMPRLIPNDQEKLDTLQEKYYQSGITPPLVPLYPKSALNTFGTLFPQSKLQLPEGCQAPPPCGVNNNATFRLGIKNINLNLILKEFGGLMLYYNQSRFQALRLRLTRRSPNGAANTVNASIFKSGKVVLVGLPQIQESLCAAYMIVMHLRRCGIDCNVYSLRGNNHVTRFNLGFDVDIDSFIAANPAPRTQRANITPSKYDMPGSTWDTPSLGARSHRSVKYFPCSGTANGANGSPMITVNCRGKGIIMGTRSDQETVRVYLDLYNKMLHHAVGRQDMEMASQYQVATIPFQRQGSDNIKEGSQASHTSEQMSLKCGFSRPVPIDDDENMAFVSDIARNMSTANGADDDYLEDDTLQNYTNNQDLDELIFSLMEYEMDM